jgi:2-polyprenyl-3-methyl-5-hydroxy-6-metoxy-1,4-benzoquinol methylase
LSTWPAHGLESVPHCPVCHGVERTVMHAGLMDYTFESAPGKWTMLRCRTCGCGYLDPRPTSETLRLAYDSYYTHSLPDDQGGTPRLVRLRRRLAASYINRRLGMNLPEPLPGGHLILGLFPRVRRFLEVNYSRDLGRASTGRVRLLDVGCGNGEFLRHAAALGWDAEGIDPDENAVAAATSTGCRAFVGDLRDPDLVPQSYHHMTMSHVIEHVPTPKTELRRCFELLVPGGRLWLETPNIDSFGHAVFGSAWRGLEPPRHLVIFNRQSLTAALVEAGFENVEFKTHPVVALGMWSESKRILSKMATAGEPQAVSQPLGSIAVACLADYWSVLRPKRMEYLTCTAFRPTTSNTDSLPQLAGLGDAGDERGWSITGADRIHQRMETVGRRVFASGHSKTHP